MKKKNLFKKFLIFQEIELSSSELKSLIFQKGSSKGMRIKKKKKIRSGEISYILL